MFPVDPRFVNNPELSDVQFLIESKIFYAHKIMLVNASQRFHAMLSSRFCDGSQNCIELSDVRYHIFEVNNAETFFDILKCFPQITALFLDYFCTIIKVTYSFAVFSVYYEVFIQWRPRTCRY